MSKIRILAIPSDKYGVGKFRVLDPYKFIGDNYSDDVHVDISFDAENNDEFFFKLRYCCLPYIYSSNKSWWQYQ